MFGIAMGNKSSIFVKRQVSLPAKAIKDNQQTRVLLPDMRLDEFDDCDVVTWLAPCTKIRG